MKGDDMSEQSLNKDLLDGRIAALDTDVSDLTEMLETDDSIPPAAMEVYERNLEATKKRLEGLKNFREIIEDLDG